MEVLVFLSFMEYSGDVQLASFLYSDILAGIKTPVLIHK